MLVDPFVFCCLGGTPPKALQQEDRDHGGISERSLGVSREWTVGGREWRPVTEVRDT